MHNNNIIKLLNSAKKKGKYNKITITKKRINNFFLYFKNVKFILALST